MFTAVVLLVAAWVLMLLAARVLVCHSHRGQRNRRQEQLPFSGTERRRTGKSQFFKT